LDDYGCALFEEHEEKWFVPLPPYKSPPNFF
jgi:hypothetical protein